MEENLLKIKNLVEIAEHKKAIDLLSRLYNSPKISLLLSDFNRLEKTRINHTISLNDYNVQLQRISENILYIVDDILYDISNENVINEEQELETNEETNEETNNYSIYNNNNSAISSSWSFFLMFPIVIIIAIIIIAKDNISKSNVSLLKDSLLIEKDSLTNSSVFVIDFNDSLAELIPNKIINDDLDFDFLIDSFIILNKKDLVINAIQEYLSSNDLTNEQKEVLSSTLKDLVFADDHNFDKAHFGYINKNSFLVIKNEKYGVYSINGDEVIPLEYDDIYHLYNGNLFITIMNNKYGLLDSMGNIIFNPVYNEIDIFTTDFAIPFFIINKDNKKGLIDSTGKIVIEPIYDDLDYIHPEILLIVTKIDNNLGIIDFKGKELFKPVLTNITPMQFGEKEGFITIQKENKYGIINSAGKIVLPIEYQNCELMDENGFIRVKKNGLWGFVNQNNQVLIPIEFDSIDMFDPKTNIVLAFVKDKKKYLNRKGNFVQNPLLK